MGYIDYLKTGFEILKLNRSAISSAAKDSEATKWSILTVVLTYLVVGLIVGLLFTTLMPLPGVTGSAIIIFYPIIGILGLFIGSGIWYLVAKLFKSEGEYMSLVRPLGLASMINVLSFIPFVSLLVSIWSLVVVVVTVSETQRLDTLKSVFVVLIPLVVLFLLSLVLGGLFVASMF